MFLQGIWPIWKNYNQIFIEPVISRFTFGLITKEIKTGHSNLFLISLD